MQALNAARTDPRAESWPLVHRAGQTELVRLLDARFRTTFSGHSLCCIAGSWRPDNSYPTCKEAGAIFAFNTLAVGLLPAVAADL